MIDALSSGAAPVSADVAPVAPDADDAPKAEALAVLAVGRDPVGRLIFISALARSRATSSRPAAPSPKIQFKDFVINYSYLNKLVSPQRIRTVVQPTRKDSLASHK
jgi:hypothetical protein